jgi:hypothetical protein
MANTYTQIYIQVVFAVQERQNLVRPERREELQKHMARPVPPKAQGIPIRPKHAVHRIPHGISAADYDIRPEREAVLGAEDDVKDDLAQGLRHRRGAFEDDPCGLTTPML